jgi:hypothetical protein
MKIWIVGKDRSDLHVAAWEFQGAYSEEADAVESCSGHSDYWIAPIEMEKDVGAETTEWPGAYYPFEAWQ